MSQVAEDPDVARLREMERRAELRRLRAVDRPREGLADFIRRVSPHEPPPRHLLPIIAKIEEASRRPVRVCLSYPPRHAKTTTLMRALAWWMNWSPADTHAYASYASDVAREKSTFIRDLAIRSGVKLRDDIGRLDAWRTKKGGGLLAAGLRAGITGKGVNGIFLVDDPIKNRIEANSQSIRDQVWNAFTEVVMTRLEDVEWSASVIVVHTRWAQDDLIGRIAKENRDKPENEQFEIINIPALAGADDPLGRAPGEALWPERFSAQYLDGVRRIQGPYSFEALYQGRPIPRGNALFGDPHYYDPEKTSFEGCRLVISADPAASVKTSADYSAAVVLAIRGFEAEMVGYVRHAYRRQVTLPQFAEDLLVMQMQWGMAPIYVESVGAFKAVAQILRQLKPDIRVVEVVPQGDKFQRAQRVAAAWNQGRVLVPATEGRAPPAWLGPFLDELAVFTGVNDAHDDLVDSLSQGWNAGPAVTMFDAVR